MCILLKFDYAKFGASHLFFSKVIEEKPMGGRLDPLGKGRGRETLLILRLVICSLLSFAFYRSPTPLEQNVGQKLH